MKYLYLVLSILILTGPASPALAFDAGEHESLSDNALLIALGMWVTQHHQTPVASTEEICRFLEASDPRYVSTAVHEVVTLVRACDEFNKKNYPKPVAITYGGAVRLVDEMLFPSRLFVPEGVYLDDDSKQRPDYPENFRELNNHYNTRRKERIEHARVEFVLQGFRALSNNEAHFQNDLLLQLEDFRRDAELRVDKYAYYALLSNAISDHFLQDYLAPGHILWPRNHSHDNSALAMHDGTNRTGAWFQVDSEYWDKRLRHVHDFLTTLEANAQGTTNRYYDELESNWLQRKVNMADACTLPNTSRPGQDGKLRDGTLKEGLDCLSTAIEAGGYVYVYGDGLISKSPAQQALLVIVQADRILELFEKLSGGKLVSKQPVQPIQSYNSDYDELRVPDSKLWFGKYRFRCPECDGKFRNSSQIFHNGISDLIIISISGQTPFKNVGSARSLYALEHIPLRIAARSRKLRDPTVHKPAGKCPVWSRCNTAVAYGIKFLHDGEFTAQGFSTRFIKAFPSIHLQLSPYVNYMQYQFDGADDWNLSWGLRADWGFSLGSFHIALGEEFFVNEARRLNSTGMISFGIGFGFPVARAKKWLFDNRRY